MAAVDADPIDVPRFGGRRGLRAGVALAGIGLLLTAIAIATSPERALLGYVAAFATVAAIAFGVLILLLVGYTANARWLAPLRRLQEGLALVFPLLAVLFVPILIGLDRIYVWAAPPADLPHHELRAIEAKSSWLNGTGFAIRSFLYLGVCALAAELLRRWSRRRDTRPADAAIDPAADGERELRRERMFSAAMLPPVALAVTFAGFDWVMSLQPSWFSSMFGVYYFAGGFGAGIAVLAIYAWHMYASSIAGTITPHHFHALGRLLFAFIVFWTYTAYFQGFLIQIANRPIEVTFFIVRLQGGWDGVLWVVLAAHFVLPFLLLLPRRLKMRPRYVAGVSGLVLFGHALDIHWLVIPSRVAAASLYWGDLASLVGIAAACIAFVVWRQRGVPVVPFNDPFLARGRAYESPT